MIIVNRLPWRNLTAEDERQSEMSSKKNKTKTDSQEAITNPFGDVIVPKIDIISFREF